MRLRDNAALALYLAVLATSLAFNVLHVWHDRTPLPAGFSEGSVMPWLHVRPVTDNTTTPGSLAFEQATLVYIFSPGCSWCEKDHKNLVTLHRMVGDKYRFVALTVGDPKRLEYFQKLNHYLQRNPYPGEVFYLDPVTVSTVPALRRLFNATPQLVVVGPGGAIHKSWVGALMGTRKRQAEDYFGIQLPGV